MWIVLFDTPASGHAAWGPFADYDEARLFALTQIVNPWYIVKVESPEEDQVQQSRDPQTFIHNARIELLEAREVSANRLVNELLRNIDLQLWDLIERWEEIDDKED